MSDRASWLVLGVGLVISAAVHLLLALGAVAGGAAASRPDPADDPPENRLGQDEPRPARIAWIDWQDYRRLVAPDSRTEQPALQKQADPLENAPVELDPAPAVPAPSEAPDTQPTPPAVPSLPAESPPAPGSSAARPDWSKLSTPAPAAPDAEPRRARPTSAPKTGREADPTDTLPDDAAVEPGKVIAGEGIEIRTARPDFAAVARVSSWPANPRVRLRFSPDTGEVIDAKLLTSSGYQNIDGPLLNSLYRWQATGEKLEKRSEPLELELKLLLIEE
ncbi:MAG: hypothetical protein ACLFV3_12420 [Phycisphaeraceae bacterium]